MQKQYAHYDRPDCTYPRPHRISRADRYGLRILGQQHHADRQADHKTYPPKAARHSLQPPHLAKAKSEAGLKTPGYNQYDPIHVQSISK